MAAEQVSRACFQHWIFEKQVVFEPAAAVGSTSAHGLTAEAQQAPLFPHLYGTIDFDAVVAELPIEREDATGQFVGIPMMGLRSD